MRVVPPQEILIEISWFKLKRATLDIKPSFAQLESWITAMEGGGDDSGGDASRRGGGRAKAA